MERGLGAIVLGGENRKCDTMLFVLWLGVGWVVFFGVIFCFWFFGIRFFEILRKRWYRFLGMFGCGFFRFEFCILGF